MNTLERAEREFRILEKEIPDHLALPFKKQILKLIKKFSKSGQSGGSAPYTIGALLVVLEELLFHRPLTPITNDLEDYVYSTTEEKTLLQHKRLSSVFLNTKNGKADCVRAVTFFCGDDYFSSNNVIIESTGNKIGTLYIKEFPFTYKHFYIEVEKREVMKDDFRYYVKNEKDLEEVFKVYSLE